MPIVLYFSRPIQDRAAVERALQVRSSKRVVGAWYWDTSCNLAAMCVYFRPRSYWPAHTDVSFTGHLDGVEVAPGVYGSHTLTQTFTIGDPVGVVANTQEHSMTSTATAGSSRAGRSAPGAPATKPPTGRT